MPPPPSMAKGDEVGGWIRETLRIARERAGHFLPMVVLLVIPLSVSQGMFTYMATRDAPIVMNLDTGEVAANLPDDFRLWAVLAAVSAVLSLAAGLVFGPAVARQVNSVACDAPETWDVSTIGAIRRLGRQLIVAAIGVGVMLASGLSLYGAFTLAPTLLVLIVPALLVFYVWFVIRFSLVSSAAAISVSGEPWLAPAVALTNGRMWMLSGRLALLGAISILVSMAAGLVAFPFTMTDIETKPGEVILWDVSHLHPAQYAIAQVLSALASGVTVVIAMTGITLLVRSLGGNVETIAAHDQGSVSPGAVASPDSASFDSFEP